MILFIVWLLVFIFVTSQLPPCIYTAKPARVPVPAPMVKLLKGIVATGNTFA